MPSRRFDVSRVSIHIGILSITGSLTGDVGFFSNNALSFLCRATYESGFFRRSIHSFALRLACNFGLQVFDDVGYLFLGFSNLFRDGSKQFIFTTFRIDQIQVV